MKYIVFFFFLFPHFSFAMNNDHNFYFDETIEINKVDLSKSKEKKNSYIKDEGIFLINKSKIINENITIQLKNANCKSSEIIIEESEEENIINFKRSEEDDPLSFSYCFFGSNASPNFIFYNQGVFVFFTYSNLYYYDIKNKIKIKTSLKFDRELMMNSFVISYSKDNISYFSILDPSYNVVAEYKLVVKNNK